MPGILVDCPIHGIQTSGIRMSGGGKVTFNNTVTQCPICGARAPIINGSYESQEGSTEIRMKLQPTPAQLRRLLTAAHWAQETIRDGAVDEEAVAERLRKTIEKESPGLVGLIDKAASPRGMALATWIAVLIALLALLTSSHSESITPEQVEHIIEQVEQGVRDDTPSTPNPEQTTLPPGPQQSATPETPAATPTPDTK